MTKLLTLAATVTAMMALSVTSASAISATPNYVHVDAEPYLGPIRYVDMAPVAYTPLPMAKPAAAAPPANTGAHKAYRVDVPVAPVPYELELDFIQRLFF